ncbi:MAG: sugar ABC transporter permease, partial [Bacilli bacterium]|nr:sugar ABC transporter permease [Bacilli bacterium]
MLNSQTSFSRKFKKFFSNMNFKRNCFVFLVLLLPTICFGIFWVYVHIDSFFLAFQLPVIGELDSYYFDSSFTNIKRVFTEVFGGGSLGVAFRNTLIYYIASTFVTFPLAILLSYFIFKKIRGYKFFRVVTYLPVIITSSALVVLFKQSINTGGPLDAIYNALGKVWEYPMNTASRAMFVMVFYSITFGFGGSIVVLCGAMNSIDSAILEAGEIDGCNWVRELFSIILPSIWPTISTILILGFVGILGASGPILAFAKDIAAPVNDITTLSYE